MAERRILLLGDPLLWRAAEPAADATSPATREVVRDLSDTLAAFRRESGFGRGIAAPQIGVSTRILFVRMGAGGFCSALVNPRFVSMSEERFELWDDCFSLPGLMVKVLRSQACEVAYSDEQGTPRTLVAKGDLSELVQHEMDHLDGILAIQRAVSPTAFCMRSEWERRYRA
jgi:peptide deformylase